MRGVQEKGSVMSMCVARSGLMAVMGVGDSIRALNLCYWV